MPELPEVEVFRHYLDSTALHKTITGIEINDSDILQDVSSRRMCSQLKGQKFESSRRHGKYLFAELSGGGWLVMHFGMTGFLKYFKDVAKTPDHARLLFGFRNSYHLAYDCQRKLGMVTLTDDQEAFVEDKKLGPDAMDPDFNFDSFKNVLESGQGMIKSTLMNQKLVAGIGNMYSDEILFQAGIHPKTPVKRLDDRQLKTLFRKMKQVLRTATDRQARPDRLPKGYITPHRSKGETCPKCTGQIEHGKVSGRTSYYCPRCQKEDK